MFDFRLKVFYVVATRLNFTKAASELFITQPAVTKHIHEIENYFKVKLFDRKGSKIKLTAAGKILLKHTKLIFDNYAGLEFEMNGLSKSYNGQLRIGASSTISQYILPPILASFREKFKDIKIKLITNNTEHIENLLDNNEIDIGIVEGVTKKKSLKYIQFIKDEIVLATNAGNSITKKKNISVKDLTHLPLLLREPGSGTLEVIGKALQSVKMNVSQLNCEMQLDSTESIKLYLLKSDCFAFLSIYSILNELKNKELSIVDIKDLAIERNLYFIKEQGEVQKLADLFMEHAINYNFK